MNIGCRNCNALHLILEHIAKSWFHSPRIFKCFRKGVIVLSSPIELRSLFRHQCTASNLVLRAF